MHNSWRVIYWLCTALFGFVTILVILTFPETSYIRNSVIDHIETTEDNTKFRVDHAERIDETVPQKRTFAQILHIFSTVYTNESFFVLIMRPIIAITLPAVFWATLISSITIGMIVAISANFSTAFSEIYGFETWQSGLTYISTIIGSLLAIFVGGHLTDYIADKLTLRNGGMRTPEMRLPALIVSLIVSPLACILYGVGFGMKLHWICAVFGIGLGMQFFDWFSHTFNPYSMLMCNASVNFTTVQATNIAIVYIVDSYRPIAGEVIVTQSVYKGLSFQK
jgi:hypothetical protein